MCQCEIEGEVHVCTKTQHLPGEMALSHALDSSLFEMSWLPREPTDVQEMDTL